MKFTTYLDIYGKAEGKGGLSPAAFYEEWLHGNLWVKMDHGERIVPEKTAHAIQMQTERSWHLAGRPYYNVWPSIADSLSRFDISEIPFSAVADAPEPTIAIQTCGEAALATVGRFECGGAGCAEPYHDMFTVVVLVGHKVITVWQDAKNMGFAGSDNWLRGCPAEHENAVRNIVATSIAVFLMQRDPSIIEPDILAADRDRYELADADRRAELAERAFKRRGQRGYHVGRLMETIPHYRRPHPCLVWTGKGRSTAKVVMRAGAVVKRQRMTEAPTGYYGAFGEAEHDTKGTT